jgi:hypothetical protein
LARKYQVVNSIITLIIATIIVIATELSIFWNAIINVNDISSAGQLIPFIIGVGAIIRILYKGMTEKRKKGSVQNGGDYIIRPWNDIMHTSGITNNAVIE